MRPTRTQAPAVCRGLVFAAAADEEAQHDSSSNSDCASCAGQRLITSRTFLRWLVPRTDHLLRPDFRTFVVTIRFVPSPSRTNRNRCCWIYPSWTKSDGAN
uniref:(northern house mosquito) hypothetical protein n=1 Tax=Culex pipiens TaxID=7175 RepID=A0A8D8A694_CULPI